MQLSESMSLIDLIEELTKDNKNLREQVSRLQKASNKDLEEIRGLRDELKTLKAWVLEHMLTKKEE